MRLGSVGDFEALHCQSSRNFDRSIKLDLTSEPPFWVGAGGSWAYFLVYVYSTFHCQLMGEFTLFKIGSRP